MDRSSDQSSMRPTPALQYHEDIHPKFPLDSHQHQSQSQHHNQQQQESIRHSRSASYGSSSSSASSSSSSEAAETLSSFAQSNRYTHFHPISMASIDTSLNIRRTDSSSIHHHGIATLPSLSPIESAKPKQAATSAEFKPAVVYRMNQAFSSGIKRPRSESSTSALTPTVKAHGSTNIASKNITLEDLRPYFEKPLAEVAVAFGICTTLMKKICRRNGISRWPYRHISALRKSVASMENAIEYIKGAEKEVYAEQLQKHRSKLEALLYNAADDENEIENQAENQDDGKEAKEENTPTKPITTGSGSSSSNHKNKKKKKKKSISSASGIANASKYITFDILRPHFEKPLVEVAELFGICPTLMKRICRKNQIPQWPYRQILALKKGIKSIKNALEHVEGTQATNLLEQLTTQEQKLQLILQNPATLVSSTASSSVKIQNPKSLGIIQEKEKKQQHFESPHHLPRQSKISPQLSPSTSPSKSSDTNTDAPTTNGGFRLPSMSSLLNH